MVMEKVGFPPGMEEHKWQGMAAGLALCGGAGHDEPAVSSWLF